MRQNKLKDERLKLGLSSEQMAQLVRMEPKAYARFEIQPNAVNRRGYYYPRALRVAATLAVEPQDLYGVPAKVVPLSLLPARPELPDVPAVQDELRKEVRRLLKTLSRREALVITMRFGNEDQDGMTREEIGNALFVRKERIKQIEAKALRKLRHPSRSKILRIFIDDGPDEKAEKAQREEAEQDRKAECNRRILEIHGAREREKIFEEKKRQEKERKFAADNECRKQAEVERERVRQRMYSCPNYDESWLRERALAEQRERLRGNKLFQAFMREGCNHEREWEVTGAVGPVHRYSCRECRVKITRIENLYYTEKELSSLIWR